MRTEDRTQLLLDYPSANWKIDLRGLIAVYEGACEGLEGTAKADRVAWKAAFVAKQDAWEDLRQKVIGQLSFLGVDVHPDEVSMIAQALVRRFR